MLKRPTGLAAAILILAGTAAVSAADLNGPRISMKDNAPASDARGCGAERFAGFYAGINGGLTSLHTKWEETFADFDDYQTSPLSKVRRGFSGGGQVGYNRARCNTVLGVEADFNFANLGGSTDHYSPAYYASGPSIGYLNLSDRMRNFGTLRARMGFVADHTLFYATGGLAWANLKHQLNDINHIDGGLTNPSFDGWKAGWTVGAGFERALTEVVSLKAEALYMDFGKRNYDMADSAVPPDPYSFRNHANVWNARVGLNFKLGASPNRCDHGDCAPLK